MFEKRPKPEESFGTVTLMLGLYLILLAFFILLNAIARIDIDNFKKTSQSVMSGFGFRTEEAVNRDEDEEISVIQVYEAISNEVYGVLESYLSVRDFDVEGDKDLMIIRLHPDVLFAQGSANINVAQVEFFNDLADTLARRRSGVQMALDIRVNAIPQQSLPREETPLTLAGDRAAILARALVERGVPPRILTATALEEDKPEIILRIQTRITSYEDAINVLQEGRQ